MNKETKYFRHLGTRSKRTIEVVKLEADKAYTSYENLMDGVFSARVFTEMLINMEDWYEETTEEEYLYYSEKWKNNTDFMNQY
jgi:hypothetical protein